MHIDSNFYQNTIINELLIMSEPLGDEFYTAITEYINWRNNNPQRELNDYLSWISNGEYEENVLDITLICSSVSHFITNGKITNSEKLTLIELLKKHASLKASEWCTNPEGWSNANKKAIDKISITLNKNLKYKIFYTDYYEDKEISGTEAPYVELKDILHSMKCVLHMPDNFLGIVNKDEQTLQFMVEKDRSILIDIPVLKKGEYTGSKQMITNLEECLNIVKSLNEEKDFHKLINDSLSEIPSTKKTSKPWWKFL